MQRAQQRKAVLVGLTGLAVLIGVTLLLFARSDSIGASSSTPPDQALGVLEPASSEARATLPEGARAWLGTLEESSLQAPEGEEVSGLGTASTKGSGDVVVASIGQYVCLYAVDAGLSGCNELAAITNGNVNVVVPGCNHHLVIGLVPDGVTHLSVITPGGAGRGSIPIVSNVYAAELDPLPTILSGATESGRALRIDMPLDTTPTNCQ